MRRLSEDDVRRRRATGAKLRTVLRLVEDDIRALEADLAAKRRERDILARALARRGRS